MTVIYQGKKKFFYLQSAMTVMYQGETISQSGGLIQTDTKYVIDCYFKTRPRYTKFVTNSFILPILKCYVSM